MHAQSPEQHPPSPEQLPESHLPALDQFVDKFTRRYGTRYGQGLEDAQAMVGEDIPGYLAEGNLGMIQVVLEGNWEVTDRRIKPERLAALRESHIADKGIPTPERVNQTKPHIQDAIKEWINSRIANGEDSKKVRKEAGSIADAMFSGNNDVEALEQAIDFLETAIYENSVPQVKDPAKIESLRIVRDKKIERYLLEKSHADAREVMIKDIVAMSGESELFSREQAEALVAPDYANGFGLEGARSVVEIAKRESDPIKREALLRDLRDGKIPIESTEKMEQWHANRKSQEAEHAEQERQRLIAKKREEMQDIFERMERGKSWRPPERQSTFQIVKDDEPEQSAAPTAKPAVKTNVKSESPEVAAARRAVEAASPTPKATYELPNTESASKHTASTEFVSGHTAKTEPKPPEPAPVVRLAPASKPVEADVAETPSEPVQPAAPVEVAPSATTSTFEAQESGEVSEETIKNAYKLAGNILSNYVPSNVVQEIVGKIAEERVKKQGGPLNPEELLQRLHKRLEGVDLPETLDERPIRVIGARIQARDWPQRRSPIWTARDPRSGLGKANLEVRNNLKRVLEELLR